MELTITIIGFCVTIATVFLTNFLTNKNELKFRERKLKEEYYIEYIKAISGSNVNENNNSSKAEAARALSDIQNRIMLIASAEVINNIKVYNDFNNRKDTTLEEHDKVYTSLIKSMRADLFSSRKVNDNFKIAYITNFKHSHDNNNLR